MKKIIPMILAALIIACCSSCREKELDYNDPDVKLFVKQLKAGTYNTRNSFGMVEVPLFTREHVGELMEYVDDMTEISSFPLPSIYSHFGGKPRLGECILWVIETVRLDHYASLGCKLVHSNADNYESSYFLTNDEVLEAAALYRKWWELTQNPVQSDDLWSIDPLATSKYRWW